MANTRTSSAAFADPRAALGPIASRPALNIFCTASEVKARAIPCCEDGHPTATSRGAYSIGQVLRATVAVAPDPDHALVPADCYTGGLTDTALLVCSSRSSPLFKTRVSRCWCVAASCLVAVAISSTFVCSRRAVRSGVTCSPTSFCRTANPSTCAYHRASSSPPQAYDSACRAAAGSDEHLVGYSQVEPEAGCCKCDTLTSGGTHPCCCLLLQHHL